MGISDHLTCLLRNLYAGQEATVKTVHETTSQYSCSVMSDLCDPMHCSTPGLPVHHQLMSIESVIPSNHLILCHLLLLLASIFTSIRVFSNESALCITWPKYWSSSFNISPSNEHPGLISFGWTGWISFPRDSQESSPTPQFRNNKTGSRSGKEYVKAVNCHPAYLTSMQSTSCEMPG